MKEQYSTSYFIANKIIDGKPSPTKFEKRCSYCKGHIINTYTFKDRERLDYYFCTCKKAGLEQRLYKYFDELNDKYKQKKLKLSRYGKANGIIIRSN